VGIYQEYQERCRDLIVLESTQTAGKTPEGKRELATCKPGGCGQAGTMKRLLDCVHGCSLGESFILVAKFGNLQESINAVALETMDF